MFTVAIRAPGDLISSGRIGGRKDSGPAPVFFFIVILPHKFDIGVSSVFNDIQ